LRQAVADRGDIAAVYWVVADYSNEQETHAPQHELHFFLVDTPEEYAGRAWFDEINRLLPRGEPFNAGLIYTIPTQRHLPAIRDAGVRIAWAIPEKPPGRRLTPWGSELEPQGIRDGLQRLTRAGKIRSTTRGCERFTRSRARAPSDGRDAGVARARAREGTSARPGGRTWRNHSFSP
jgi:hypothetical protein